MAIFMTALALTGACCKSSCRRLVGRVLSFGVSNSISTANKRRWFASRCFNIPWQRRRPKVLRWIRFSSLAKFSTFTLTCEILPDSGLTVSAINSLVAPFLRMALAAENGMAVTVVPWMPEPGRPMLTFVSASSLCSLGCGLMACRTTSTFFNGLMIGLRALLLLSRFHQR